MTCEFKETRAGPMFICWSGKPPKDPKVRCSVCRKRWSTLLCDGKVDGAARDIVVDGKSYRQWEAKTCDVPLCERCTTRPAPGVVIALPDHRDGDMNGVYIMQTERRMELARRRRGPASRLRDDLPLPAAAPVHVDVPEDTVDFCPDCAERMSCPRQGDLFGGTS